jgi:hypothetical protein
MDSGAAGPEPTLGNPIRNAVPADVKEVGLFGKLKVESRNAES